MSIETCRAPVHCPVLLGAFWRITFAPLDAEPYDYEGLIKTHIDVLLRGLSAGEKP